MSERSLKWVFAGLLLLPSLALGGLPDGKSSAQDSPTELVVRFHENISPLTLQQHAISLDIELVDATHPRLGRLGLLRLGTGVDPAREAEYLMETGLVSLAEPNWQRRQHVTTPNDPRFSEQYALAIMKLPLAWDIETGDDAVIIAVIDGSFSTSHEDLAGNMIAGRCFGSCTSDPTNVEPGSSSDSHGTRVAGVSGAVGNNLKGITGVAWNVSIMPLKTNLTVSSIVQAIQYAIDNGAHIINASYGGAQFSQVEFDAISAANDAGILFVTSAGNFDSDNDKARLSFPQTYDIPNIIAVASTDSSDRRSHWSQYGQTSVRLAAPGEDILSTRPGNAYGFASGTSFAAPMIAGIAALLHSNRPGLTLEETIARLVAGADPIPDLRGRVQSGRANAFKTLQDGLLDSPVLIIEAIDVDDSVTGNGNAALDAGESADLLIRVGSLWGDAATVSGTLTLIEGSDFLTLTDDTDTAAGPQGPPSASSVDLRFGVSVSDGIIGNHRALLKLDLEDDQGETTTRWFSHEVGLLVPQRTLDWDFDGAGEDFHAYHVDLPAGATNLRIATETAFQADIDLLAREGALPQYMISLGTDPQGSGAFFEVGPGTRVSGRFDGNELIEVADPASGIWHLVVVNFVQASVDYRLTVSWCTPAGCPSRVRFGQQSYQIQPSQDAVISVVREGGTQGAVSVGYSTNNDGGSASPGVNYTEVSGTLTWAAGESGTKTFTVPIGTRPISGSRTFLVRLDGASGAFLAVPSMQVPVVIPAQTAPPPPPDPGTPPPRRGGGMWDPASLLVLSLLLWMAIRRRVKESHDRHP